MRKHVLSIIISMFTLVVSTQAISVVLPDNNKDNTFIKDQLLLRSSITLPANDVAQTLKMPVTVIKNRIKKSQSDERIEEFGFNIPKNNKARSKLARQLAKPSRASKLNKYFTEKYNKAQSQANSQNNGYARISIDAKGYNLMSPKALSNLYFATHHKVQFDTKPLLENKGLRSEFLRQIQDFISPSEVKRISEKISRHESLNLEHDLLTEFGKKMVRKYLIFKGPNCFHASLAFHDPLFPKSRLVNFKREKGYHKAMINYDELWKSITSQFYEVDVNASPLKYGDMLVFFELPENYKNTPISFKWIRHATTYLMGSYTFSKGSKSPDTPYSIKTLQEEWATWQKYVKNLGVKVYRKNAKNVSKIPPKSLVDWIY